ncbi:serine/threonine-protein kinase [Bradymonas sediminis]|uniref:Uncharacterized protein n=1 Tax=Bradymonas sediminis TaxID=1548548 RepID=A0A2Z4FPD5_9DELT|nr:serine/threonine-protein kinase [Bradymonas sediminis]AWV90859.1 hypothetical protein DN745_16640 [Bradymonas sediminis]TDP75404.1 serine/threonine protein kinase [Bradymonas sediminis]
MISQDPEGRTDGAARVGELLGGRYRVESVIGYGALGMVLRARHITMGREVALKLLRPDISGHPAIRRRLIRQVHLAQNLYHPNNCRLLDFGQADGSLYLVMELLQGATLRTLIERGAPFSVGWVLDIGMQILDGLGEAHAQGQIHRNLKPRNIILLPRRRGGQQVKVMDYGLAASLDALPGQDPDDDREAEICGTAAYLAPETLVHQKSCKATDVYAVALMLLEMLTGQQTFRGDTLTEVLYSQIHTRAQLPPKLAWTTLGKALLAALNKHPGNRFVDADAFYEALDHASQTTATYFRLDLSDLAATDVAMPPEMLARMVRNQRARQKSNGNKGSGSDEDSDEAEPAAKPPLAPRPTRPSPNTQSLNPDTPSWGALMQLTSDISTPLPPPFPLPASHHASAPRTALRAQPAPPLRPPPAFARPANRSGVKDLVETIDAPKSAYLAAPIEGKPAAEDWLSHAGVVLIGLLLALAAFGVYLAISIS